MFLSASVFKFFNCFCCAVLFQWSQCGLPAALFTLLMTMAQVITFVKCVCIRREKERKTHSQTMRNVYIAIMLSIMCLLYFNINALLLVIVFLLLLLGFIILFKNKCNNSCGIVFKINVVSAQTVWMIVWKDRLKCCVRNVGCVQEAFNLNYCQLCLLKFHTCYDYILRLKMFQTAFFTSLRKSDGWIRTLPLIFSIKLRTVAPLLQEELSAPTALVIFRKTYILQSWHLFLQYCLQIFQLPRMCAIFSIIRVV